MPSGTSAATVAIIQARMGSRRFPGKTLRMLGGEPLLGCLLARLARASALDRLVVATSDQPEDDVIAEFCRRRGAPVFRGHPTDVLDRYHAAADWVGATTVVRVTADCPLLDPAVVDQVVAAFHEGGADYVSNAAPLPSSFPDGMDVEVFSMAALRRAWREAVKPSHREHVTFYFWQDPGLFAVRRVDRAPDWSSYRLTVDTPEDLAVLEALATRLGPGFLEASMEEIVGCVDPAMQARMRQTDRTAGWQPALRQDRAGAPRA